MVVDIVVSNPLASAMVLLFVVCGWREEAVAGVCLRTYLGHFRHTFFWLPGLRKTEKLRIVPYYSTKVRTIKNNTSTLNI